MIYKFTFIVYAKAKNYISKIKINFKASLNVFIKCGKRKLQIQ